MTIPEQQQNYSALACQCPQAPPALDVLQTQTTMIKEPTTMTTIQNQIETRLQEALQPSHLEVINESGKHNVPAGSELHFKVIAVSKQFQNCTRIQRQQTLHTLLKDFLANKIHALSMSLYTPEEWQNHPNSVPATPPCRGGLKAPAAEPAVSKPSPKR